MMALFIMYGLTPPKHVDVSAGRIFLRKIWSDFGMFEFPDHNLETYF